MHCTRHRVFLATLIVTAKYLNDSSPKNKHWAKYASMFSLAEVTLMEKQLLYLLDYDLRMSEDELLHHFQPFLRRATPPSPPPVWSTPTAVRTPQTLRNMPSLEACSPSSTASSLSPVTPGSSSTGRGSRDMVSPSTSPIRRTYHVQEKSPFAMSRRASSAVDEEEQSARRVARGSIASLQAAAQQAARRGSAAAHYNEHVRQTQQEQLSYPLSDAVNARRESQVSALRTKNSSGNLLASVRGYFKGINSSREHTYESNENTITVDGGIQIVQ